MKINKENILNNKYAINSKKKIQEHLRNPLGKKKCPIKKIIISKGETLNDDTLETIKSGINAVIKGTKVVIVEKDAGVDRRHKAFNIPAQVNFPLTRNTPLPTCHNGINRMLSI